MSQTSERLKELINEYGEARIVQFSETRIKQLEKSRDPQFKARALARAKEKRNAEKIELGKLREELARIKGQSQEAHAS
jgi:hypothetical protein